MDHFTDYTGRKLLAKTVPWIVGITLLWCSVVLGLWYHTQPLYIINLANKTQMRRFLKRTTQFQPKPFKNKPQRAYFDLQCNARLERYRKSDPHRYRNATAILLGKHEKHPNVYACLLTVVSDVEAKGLCESDNKEFVRNDTPESHLIICRHRRSDHEVDTDNEERTP